MTTGFGPSSCGIGVTSAHSGLSEIGSCLELIDTSSSDDSLILGLGFGLIKKSKPGGFIEANEIDFLYEFFLQRDQLIFSQVAKCF